MKNYKPKSMRKKYIEAKQEYKFEITIEGVDGSLFYSIDAANEEEARGSLNFFLECMPFQIKLEGVYCWPKNLDRKNLRS